MREVSRSRLTGHGTLNYAARQPGIDFKLCSPLPRCGGQDKIKELRLYGGRHLKSANAAGGVKPSYELSRKASLMYYCFTLLPCLNSK